MTIEGARKILLFFSISFVYKYILSYIVIWLLPQQKITDFFGFGIPAADPDRNKDA